MDTIEYATFRYDTVEVENGLNVLMNGLRSKRRISACIVLVVKNPTILRAFNCTVLRFPVDNCRPVFICQQDLVYG